MPEAVGRVHRARQGPVLRRHHAAEPAQENVPAQSPREVPGTAGNRYPRFPQATLYGVPWGFGSSPACIPVSSWHQREDISQLAHESPPLPGSRKEPAKPRLSAFAAWSTSLQMDRVASTGTLKGLRKNAYGKGGRKTMPSNVGWTLLRAQSISPPAARELGPSTRPECSQTLVSPAPPRPGQGTHPQNACLGARRAQPQHAPSVRQGRPRDGHRPQAIRKPFQRTQPHLAEKLHGAWSPLTASSCAASMQEAPGAGGQLWGAAPQSRASRRRDGHLVPVPQLPAAARRL